LQGLRVEIGGPAAEDSLKSGNLIDPGTEMKTVLGLGRGMKVLHVPYCYYPDPVGGTEIYVASLARVQQARSYEVAIAAPAEQSGTYFHDGLPVYRFGIAGKIDLRQLYGEGDPTATANFQEVLDRFRPDVLHLHAFTSAVSAPLAQSARSRRIPVVFTYHTPTVTCCRGTMLEWGNRVCDGEMRVNRCARCMLHGKGVPAVAGWLLGTVPETVGGLAGTAGLEGGMWTAFRGTELVGIRHAAARRFLSEDSDHIFAVCEWVRAVLVANGVPPGKITLSRQGSPYSLQVASMPAAATTPCKELSSSVRCAFLGRFDPAKGLQVLIDAMAVLPDIDLRLDVFAVAQGEEARRRQSVLLDQVRHDRRIQFMTPLDATEVVERLRCYDALLVPSQGLETGPLVVYEAFAAGIPVIGSALGGIAELVGNGENGILIDPPGSAAAWAEGIGRLTGEAGLLRKLKAAPKPFRTAEDAADDASEVYAALLHPGTALAATGMGAGTGKRS
jgi:glycosyltransferase involved in cell wall biosynthesis